MTEINKLSTSLHYAIHKNDLKKIRIEMAKKGYKPSSILGEDPGSYFSRCDEHKNALRRGERSSEYVKKVKNDILFSVIAVKDQLAWITFILYDREKEKPKVLTEEQLGKLSRFLKVISDGNQKRIYEASKNNKPEEVEG